MFTIEVFANKEREYMCARVCVHKRVAISNRSAKLCQANMENMNHRKYNQTWIWNAHLGLQGRNLKQH